MKRLIFEDTKKIHISELKPDDIIIAKKKGKIIGLIAFDSGWYSFTRTSESQNWSNLSDMIKNSPLEGCEFFVLE